ncbi:MAG: IS1182 family transposase [Actinomycetota bacterium]|nr:IS1182 family transposase [Actinomycetota bacterium]
MTLGLAERQGGLLDDVVRFCDRELPRSSVYALLHRERDRLFPDELFADLFSDAGRRSVPPSVVATVMVLQRLDGLSDREAVERYCFDARWRYAAGVGGYDSGGWGRFAHTVLVDMRERLRRSKRPDRVFEVALEAARAAGLVGRRRVLDSTPLYDAVATMDTVTLIRSAIRGLLAVAGAELEAELRNVLARDDDYGRAGKPSCAWDDAEAREALVDELALDAFACLMLLDGRDLEGEVARAATLLAAVAGQDLDLSGEVFRIARRVVPDRIISTVDPETRHGHKTAARGFDGYKGHVAVDPDSEIITATTVTAGNAGDASVAEDLIADLRGDQPPATTGDNATTGDTDTTGESERAKVYGDQAYGTGVFQSHLEDNNIDSGSKTQAPSAPGGLLTKDRFAINLKDDTVTCPNEVTVAIRRGADGGGTAHFGDACATCPLRDGCTKAAGGRTISVGPHEEVLARARKRQAAPEWQDDYRATRPKVERKLGHLMRRKHGGRRARVRGKAKVGADFNLLGAAANVARLAVLGLHYTTSGWAAAPA